MAQAAAIDEMSIRASDVTGQRSEHRLQLTATTDAPPACREAVAIALLRLAGSVRLVRATLTPVDVGITATLHVGAQPPIHTTTVDRALSSLTVAHQQVAAELEALAGDNFLASTYLAIQCSR